VGSDERSTACNSFDDLPIFFWSVARRSNVFLLPGEEICGVDHNRFLDERNVDNSSSSTNSLNGGCLCDLNSRTVKGDMWADTAISESLHLILPIVAELLSFSDYVDLCGIQNGIDTKFLGLRLSHCCNLTDQDGSRSKSLQAKQHSKANRTGTDDESCLIWRLKHVKPDTYLA